MMKKILSMFLAFCCAFSFVACSVNEGISSSTSTSEEAKPTRLGLYAGEDGTLMKDGEPFYGFGVNYYGLINSSMGNGWTEKSFSELDVQNSLKSLEVLASYDVRVIRFNAGVYYGHEWQYIIDGEERYFEVFDAIADKAAELNIGLIPCLFWGCVPDYYSEPMGASWRTDKSKTMQFMASFTEKVVKRYAQHAGIYGWEFSNETNLVSDLDERSLAYMSQPRPDGTPRTSEDLITTEYYKNALSLFAETVKRCDPHKRIIGNGDAESREEAYNLSQMKGWRKDTKAEHEAIIDLLNEDMTAISTHRYPGGASAVDAPKELGQYLDCYNDWPTFMEYMVSQAKRTKKPVYLGETGFVYSDARTRIPVESIMTVINEIVDAAVGAGMQLTLFWNYDHRSVYNESNVTDRFTGGTEHSWNENWEKGAGILQAIKEGNQALDQKYKNI